MDCSFVKTISKLASYSLKGKSVPRVVKDVWFSVSKYHTFIESLTFHTGNLFIGGALGVAISQYKKQLGITEQKQPGKKTGPI